MLSVIYAQWHKQAHYADWHYVECRYAECRGAADQDEPIQMMQYSGATL